ncbi:MAG: ATP-dependent helicase [Marinifilaceae bacterium]|jgi:superfamily I DNA/RNA helicase|nr:ATP-dependent helicase [Marinifilaceae bacterium]
MILSGLTDEQKDAVTCPNSLLLTACPGSGKTRVLIHKVAYELSRLDNPKQYVVALTFTHRATDEIKERIDRLNIETEQLWAGTIHSFCLDWIIRPYAGFLNILKNGFAIADAELSDDLLDRYRNAHKEKFVQKYGRKEGKNRLYKITTRLTKDGQFETEGDLEKEVLQNYYRDLKSQKLINFDLLLYLAFLLIKKYPAVQNNLARIFNIIFVDEYQDTQELQYAILHKIVSIGKTRIVYVGDPNQAIYGTMGGIAKNKATIDREANIDIDEIVLHGNWRSHQRLVDYYRNFQVQYADINAVNTIYKNEQGIIKYIKDVSEENLIDCIADLITSELSNEIPYNEICVIAPQWQLITPLGGKLKAKLPDIPFDAFGLSPFRKSRDNFWYKLARLLLTEPSSNYFLTRIRWAKELIIELEEHIQSELHEEYRTARILLKLINSINPDIDKGIDYLKDAFEQFSKSLNFKIDDFQILKQQYDLFFQSIEKRLADKDYEYPEDVDSWRKLFKPRSGIVIETCHGVKGEEFEVVIAFGLLQGKLPYWDCIFKGHDKGISDANKLLYVIASRAKRNLYLISETGRKTQSKSEYLPTEQLKCIEYEYDK